MKFGNKCLSLLAMVAAVGLAQASEVTFYENDFETPNQTPQVTCATNLDQTPINAVYGTDSNQFGQRFTVETVSIDKCWDGAACNTPYANPQGKGGKYAIGMLRDVQDDLLSLDFTIPEGTKYFNVDLDISAIDVNGCGGPFTSGGAQPAPVFQLDLYDMDIPDSVGRETITGAGSANQWTFNWSHHQVVFQPGEATNLKIKFDLTHGSSGYAVLDNLRIWGSDYDPRQPTPSPAPICASTEIELYGDQVNNNPPGPLAMCEGDCDNDNHCGGCLVCHQFSSVSATPPAGCCGSIFNHPRFGVYDYCACPPGGCPDDCFGPVRTAPPTEEICASTEIELYGDQVNNNPPGPLAMCEGDCDNDNHCGGCLVCHQFSSVSATPPAGCCGSIFNHPRFGVYDYCACPPGGCPDDCFGPVDKTLPEPTPSPKPTPSPTPEKASGSGDPHFKTWTGDKFDYHGECDLVLIDNPSFEGGLGLKLHIRTTRIKYFSFIQQVALQIGNETLEFDNDVENFLINGAVVEANHKHHKTMLGNFVIRRDPKAISVRLHKEGKAKIDFHTRKNGFPAVIVDGGNTDVFKGSLGLLGDWATGRRLSREGLTEMKDEDATAFALEWQVRDTEPMLFSKARHPQYPKVCVPPAKMQGNRLGGSGIEKEAEEACAHWEEDREDCIFDVMATRDVLVAAEGHIVHIE